MKRQKTLLSFIIILASALSTYCQIPHLETKGGGIQLIVDGKPFLMLAGEVNNSSGSNIKHMDRTLKAWKESGFNSSLVSISWEIIEPKEGIFDFTSVDELLRIARENDMKLGFLWFASWKNGLSPYAPGWVLKDTKRFVRVKDSIGQNTRTLSPLCSATRDADSKAFTELMKHIAAIDSKENTVIIIQIENEVGILGQTRDFGAESNKLIKAQVPNELINYMVKNKKNLEIELKSAWEKNGSKTKGTWNEVFGDGDYTDMFFMAWQYARYMNTVAEAGKKMYNIPMYVNCWMTPSRPNVLKPGNFPSGGPVLAAIDIWKAGAPSIDIIAPDIYGADFKVQSANFHRKDNPLFIPETRGNEGAATWAFAQHDAICFAPFGIDRRPESMAAEYKLLGQMIPLISQYQSTGKMLGLYRESGDTTRSYDYMLNNDIKIIINFQPPFQRPTTSAGANTQNQQQGPQVPPRNPASYGLFIQTGDIEFIVAGINLTVTAVSTNPKKEVWLKDSWEGVFENGVWKQKVLLNGDEGGFLRGDNPSYGIRAYQTMPIEPAILKFSLIVYDK